KTDLKTYWMEWVFLVIILLAGPLFVFPRAQFLWLTAIVPVLFVFTAVLKKRILPRTPLDWALLVLLLEVLATCLLVPDLMFSLAKITGVLYGILLFYALVAVVTRPAVWKWLAAALLAGSGAFTLFCLAGLKWDYDSLIFSLARFFGIPLDKTVFTRKVIPALESIFPRLKFTIPGADEGFQGNVVGGFIILILPLCLALILPYLLRKRMGERIFHRRRPLWLLLPVLFVLSVVLFLTLSFSCWVALAAGIWLYFFSRRTKIWSVALLVVLLFFVVVINPSGFEGFSKAVSQDLDPEKVDYRLKWWGVAVETVEENPVFGVGMTRIRLHPDVGYERSHVHNHFLQTAAEMGIPALLAYLFLVGGALWMCVRVARSPGESWMRPAALGLGCGQLAHLLYGFVDSIPLGSKVGIFFWLSLAAATSLYLINRKPLDAFCKADHLRGF
ncbi:MAG: O-antigen ligase family protein, partial [Acidobacteria bacterium]|nr:O-antigen ligase family protein [Acidobacteriota bacterium]